MYSSTGPVNKATFPTYKYICSKRTQVEPTEGSVFVRTLTVSSSTPCSKLPKDKAKSVHVNAQERVTLKVDSTFQDFRSHVAPRSHLQVQKSKDEIKNLVIYNRESK